MICREKPVLVSTDGLIPLFSYRLWNRELMFRWKSQEEREFSSIFARLLCQGLRMTGDKVLVPVPPRKGKIRKKGWDQINDLTHILKYFYVRNTSNQQKKLSRSQRLESIKSAYSLCSKELLEHALKPFSGQLPESLCLIDDVCTTGSTIESCAAILKAAGVKKVRAFTLFTVD